jgi:hypothetical protein
MSTHGSVRETPSPPPIPSMLQDSNSHSLIPASIPKNNAAASRSATLPPIDVPKANRLSVHTQHSTTSAFTSASSLYPQSSYLSATDSVASDTPTLNTPSSYHGRDTPRVDTGQEGSNEIDDVSYRLKLLVSNNYRLPPAHHKPPELVVPGSDASLSKLKSPSSGFLDIFRRSRSRSKPTTPTGSLHLEAPPILRTTSESIISASPQSRKLTSPIVPSRSLSGFQERPQHRIAVVREQVNDLQRAIKIAEQDLRSKAQIDPAPISVQSLSVIDPTDSVDIPPPASSYPFAVQASALHAMGVHDSLGAAILADRLPPSDQSVTISLMSQELSPAQKQEQDWRKILLQEAVSNSLDNSVNSSMASPVESTPIASSSVSSSSPCMSSYPIASQSVPVSQRIIAHPVITSTGSPSHEASPRKPQRQIQAQLTDPRPSLNHLRSETPCEPHIPLAPPPRRIAQAQSPAHQPMQAQNLRKEGVTSCSALQQLDSLPSPDKDIYRKEMVMTPPPLSIPRFSVDTVSDERRSTSGPLATFFSRSASALSARTDTSSSSLAGSAFFDARGFVTASPVERPSQDSVIPPPRTSSASYILTHNKGASPSIMPRQSMLSTSRSSPPHSLRLGRGSSSIDVDHHSEKNSGFILEPGPSTPPLPTVPDEEPLTLHFPRPSENRTPKISTSSTAPSGSFFDDIQSHHNAMDDLDSSDDDDDGGETHQDNNPPLPPPFIFRQPNTSHTTIQSTASTSKMEAPSRQTFTRWGNHSSPSIAGYESSSSTKGKAIPKDRKPVENVPMKRSFFTGKKSSTPVEPSPLSTFDFYQNAQRYPAQPLPGPGRISIGSQKSTRSRAQEEASFKELDGLLLQHMKTEKDTLKRIADRQVNQSKNSRPR